MGSIRRSCDLNIREAPTNRHQTSKYIQHTGNKHQRISNATGNKHHKSSNTVNKHQRISNATGNKHHKSSTTGNKHQRISNAGNKDGFDETAAGSLYLAPLVLPNLPLPPSVRSAPAPSHHLLQELLLPLTH